jgi:hypothetical protein
MKLSEAIPVRFSPVTGRRLRWVSERSGIPVAQLIRLATESYLEQVDRSGKITIEVAGGGAIGAGAEPAGAGGGTVEGHARRRKLGKKTEAKRPATVANLKAHLSAVEAAKLAADKVRKPSA